MGPTFASLAEDFLWRVEHAQPQQPVPFERVTDTRRRIVNEFLSLWKATVGDNIYPAARLCLPEKDRDRVFFIKDKTLAKYVVQLAHIPQDSDDAKTINAWKTNYRDQVRSQRTLADILGGIIATRRLHHSTGGILTVEEVNGLLDQLNNGSSETHMKVIGEFLDKMNAKELRFIFKIILKQKVLGRMESHFFEQWRHNGLKIFNVTGDLKEIFLSSETDSEEHDAPSIQLMKPFAPQLSPFPAETYEKLAKRFDSEFWIEEKLDGERIQIHMDFTTGTFKYYSRKGKDYSVIYGETSEVPGSLSSRIVKEKVFVDGVRNCIVDGEMVAWDEEKQAILPFGTLKGAALLQISEGARGSDSSAVHPLFIAFDLVYLNGQTYEKYNMRSRRAHLERIVKHQLRSHFEILEHFTGKSGGDIERAINKAVERDAEGIILKDPMCPYNVGTRDVSWIKVKPHYFEELADSLDLIVVGRNHSVKSTFVCALLEKEVAEGETPRCLSLCNVANGFSRQDYQKIATQTGRHWCQTAKRQAPRDLIDFGEVQPEEWIDPRHSVVLEVRARSVNADMGGHKFGAKTTLINAFCKGMRTDKDWRTATTLEQYRQMRIPVAQAERKPSVKKEKPLTSKQIHMRELKEGIQVDVEDELFAGLLFHILSDYKVGTRRITQQQLYKMVKQHGGEVTYTNPQDVAPHLRYMIVSQARTRDTVLGALKRGFVVFHPQWIVDCIEADAIVPIEPIHCFGGPDSALRNAIQPDIYGDSYFRPIDVTSFDFSGISDISAKALDPDLLSADLFADYEVGILATAAKYEAAFDLEELVILNGGTISDPADATLVVVVGSDASELVKEAKNELFARKVSVFPRFVTENYVFCCLAENTLLPPERFLYT